MHITNPSLSPMSLDAKMDNVLTGSQSPAMFSSNLVGGSRRKLCGRGKFKKIYKSCTKRNSRRVRTMKKRAKKIQPSILTKLLNTFSSKKNKKRRMKGGYNLSPTELDVTRATANPASIGVGTSCKV
jgi:hypothetical protein